MSAAEAEYHVVTGVGFGSLNAAFLDQYAPGKEVQAA